MAAKLFNVRRKFVNSVSPEVIKQPLDDLLYDGVLNKGEKDTILEGTNIRDDRARELIDKVKKKGDHASNKMITRLQERGTQNSFPTWVCLNVHLLRHLQSPKRSSSGRPLSFPQLMAFTKKKPGTALHSMRNRVALLINNIHFQQHSKRNGAEKDENMEKLLSELKYDVVKYRDLTAKQIDEALSEFSKHPKLKQTDSVFVVIMSHGQLGVVLGINDDEFPIDKIYEHLGSERCPALVDKPKVIIIQACRGRHTGAAIVSDGVESDVSLEDVIEADRLKYVHKEKDFVSFFSSTPHAVSYRDTIKGSFLIQFIVEVFYTCAHEKHIEELFMKVMRRFEKLEIRKQMPTKDRCTLTKYLYLFPGH